MFALYGAPNRDYSTQNDYVKARAFRPHYWKFFTHSFTAKILTGQPKRRRKIRRGQASKLPAPSYNVAASENDREYFNKQPYSISFLK